MKRFTFAYVFLFLVFAASLSVHAVTSVSTTDGGGNADTLEGQNGSYYLDVGNQTGESSFGSLVDDNTGLGVTYDLTTSFQTYTSYDTTNTSSDITASTSNGTLTIGADSGGEYSIEVDIATTAVGGPELEFGVFLNLTSEIASFTRGIRGVHHHPPVFIHLSSNAVYDTYSTIDRLEFTDSNEIWIDEASSGTSPLWFEMTFNDEVLYPTNMEFFGILYDGSAAHEVEAKMWNYSTSAWVDMRSDVKDFPDSQGTDAFRYYDREFGVPAPISSYVNIATKEAKVLIDHTSTGSPGHELRIDKVQLHDSHNSAAISFSRILTIPGGSVISVKVKSDLVLPSYFVNMHLHITKVSN